MNDAFVSVRRQELRTRWERLSALLASLEKQRDEETRAEEKIRLSARIAEIESERHAIERRLSELPEPSATPVGTPHAEPVADEPRAPVARPLRLFYSYAHEDEALRDELARHLAILERQGIVSAWHDRRIAPGSRWEDEIDERLDAADIVLLLVSPSFVASDYCWGRELARAMERHRCGEAAVVPVILRDVDWTGAPFASLQALPRDARPVARWEDRDQAYAEICRSLRTLASTRP